MVDTISFVAKFFRQSCLSSHQFYLQTVYLVIASRYSFSGLLYHARNDDQMISPYQSNHHVDYHRACFVHLFRKDFRISPIDGHGQIWVGFGLIHGGIGGGINDYVWLHLLNLLPNQVRLTKIKILAACGYDLTQFCHFLPKAPANLAIFSVNKIRF